jgi:hypothetical protein
MMTYVLLVVLALLTVWAVRAAHRAAVDGPAWLLATAVRGLPADRRDWGTAMTAELGHLTARPARWRFALGCARVALFPPRPGQRAAAAATVLGAVAVAVATGVVTHRTVPAAQLFGVTLVALAGAYATLTAARGRRPSLDRPGPLLAIVILAGVAGAVAITGYVLATYPLGQHVAPGRATDGRSPHLLVAGAVLLIGYAWLALTPPRAMTTDRRARRLGAGVGLAVGLGFAPVAATSYDGALFYMLTAPTAGFLLCAAVGASRAGQVRAGVEAALWAAPVVAVLFFAGEMLTTLYRFQLDAALLDDGHVPGHGPDLAVWFPSLVGQDLGAVIFSLLWFPAWALLLGLVGGTVARSTSTRSTSTRTTSTRTTSTG